MDLDRDTVEPEVDTACLVCPQGHLLDDANTYRLGGQLFCRTCQEERKAARAPQPYLL